MGPISALSLAYALKHADAKVREHGGANRGPEVEAWLKRMGVAPGNAWCAAFAWCCVDDACKDLGRPNPLPRRAGVLNMWRETPSILRTFKIAPGAIFIMDHGKGKGHTGFVTDVGTDSCKTIEGNTSVQGSRDGDGVYIRARSFDELKGFIVLD